MRRIIFTCLLFCSGIAVSFAQPKLVTLSGSIMVNTGETFPYKIAFTEAGGIIKGYSLTYKEPDETKATIQGMLDRRSHTLTFKETDIIYAHSYHTKAFMCLIDAKLGYAQSAKGTILKGPITSMEADKTACTGGTVTFSNDEEIQYLFAYHDKLDTMITMKKRVREPAAENSPVAQQPLITEKITAGIEKTYDWHTDTVVIDIWDGGNIDGDRVTLQFNGNTYLTNYYLAKEKKQLRIPLTNTGVNTLTIIADNEGLDPPNTASLLLTDGGTKYSVLAYNNKGQKCILKIKKVKP